MKIDISNGMVFIYDDRFIYSNIRNLYKDNNGVGLQISEGMDYDTILTYCNIIADEIYKLQDMIGDYDGN